MSSQGRKQAVAEHARSTTEPDSSTAGSDRLPNSEVRQVVVLGMHRSGTSAVTGTLGCCGLWLGRDGDMMPAAPDNPRGFNERSDIYEANRALMQAGGAEWWRVSGFDPRAVPSTVLADVRQRYAKITQALDQHGAWAIKDPRLCVTLSAIKDLLYRPVAVIVHRNPVEVALSLRKRNGFGVAEGLALWEAYNRAALAVTEDVTRVLVAYEDLCHDPVATTQRLVKELQRAGVSGLQVPDPERLAEHVDPNLQHNVRDEANTRAYLTGTQAELFDALHSGAALEQVVRPELSGISHQHLLDLESRQGALERARQDASRHRERADRLARERDAAREDAQNARSEAAEKDRRIAALSEELEQARVAQRHTEEARRSERAQFEERAKVLAEWREDLKTECERLRDEATEAGQILKSRDEELAKVKAARDAALQERDAARQRLSSDLAKAHEEHKAHHSQRVAELTADRDRQLERLRTAFNQLLGRYLLSCLKVPDRGPLRKLRVRRVAKRLRARGLIDEQWYRQAYPDVASGALRPAEHYLRFGAAEGRVPGPDVARLPE